MNVAGLIEIMAKIAPPHLAEEWDNTGLQFGKAEWTVNHVFLALEPTLDAVNAACRAGADMLITHHPLIFKPLASIDLNTPTGAIIETAARERLAVFAAHTNLDSAEGGVNDALCQKIGLKACAVLGPSVSEQQYKIVFFVPEDHTDAMVEAVCQGPAGRIGNYSCCTFRSPGRGTFRPEAGAQPFEGRVNELSDVAEVRMETVARKKDLKKVIEHLKARHPYETMAYDVYPLESQPSGSGLGRIGTLEPPRKLADLAMELKRKLGLQNVRFSGPPELSISRAAVCSGSGGSLLSRFLDSPAQVLVTGDMKYHDAIRAVQQNKALIDIGHFASEHPIVEILRDRIVDAAADAGESIRVTVYAGESDPFTHI